MIETKIQRKDENLVKQRKKNRSWSGFHPVVIYAAGHHSRWNFFSTIFFCFLLFFSWRWNNISFFDIIWLFIRSIVFSFHLIFISKYREKERESGWLSLMSLGAVTRCCCCCCIIVWNEQKKWNEIKYGLKHQQQQQQQTWQKVPNLFFSSSYHMWTAKKMYIYFVCVCVWVVSWLIWQLQFFFLSIFISFHSIFAFVVGVVVVVDVAHNNNNNENTY